MTQKRFTAKAGLDGNSLTITNVGTASATTDAVNKAMYDAVATTSVAGIMSATDKTKLDGIAANATTNTGTVTSVAALTLSTTGTDLSSSVTNGTTTPIITLNVPTASATKRGALSSADWTTFNGKGSGNGTVTSVSITSGNGLAGTVTNPTTTPAIALSTTVTGMLKGNGTAISAATAGTDYVAPQTTLSGYGITDAYTKTQTDSLLQGLDPKQSVKAATTVNGTLATAYTNTSVIDGITLVTGDRILIKDQTAPAENGIYIVAASGVPARAVDMNDWTEVPNSYLFVETGTVNADLSFVCISNQGGTININAITWIQFASATLPNTGTAGTYTKVTTDAQGRVTAGSTPTTLAGYSIGDALNTTSNATIPLVNGAISSVTATTTGVTASQSIDTSVLATYRSIRYTIQATNGAIFQLSEVLLIHDGATVINVVEYGTLNIGVSLASYDGDINGLNVRLLVSPTQAVGTTTYKIIKTTIAV
jgi:hypothetical protein